MMKSTAIKQESILFTIKLNDKETKLNPILQQFSVVWVDLPKYNDSREQHIQSGKRPAIIMSNNECNKYSPVINVIPLTSKDKAPWLPTHYSMTEEESLVCGLKEASVIMSEGYIPIGKKRILGYIGKLSNDLILNAYKVMLSQLGCDFIKT